MQGIDAGSPAAAAELETGDLIVRYDGEMVSGIDQLQRVLDHHRIGRQTSVVLLRRAQLHELSITARERP